MKTLFLSAYTSLFALAAMAPEGVGSAPAGKDGFMGLTGRVAHVHKKDAEGLLQIDAVTGQVIPGQHDRPEWAEELVMAQLAERHIFYASRIGEAGYTAEMRNPDVYAFEDLGWLATRTSADDESEEDREYVLEADDEFRMEVIAAVLEINRSENEGGGTIKGVIAEIEVASDNTRTAAELAALEETQAQRFAATGTGE